MANQTNSGLPPITVPEDELTLKELILKIKTFLLEVKRLWYILAISVLLMVAYMVYNALTTPVTFPAKLTFMVNEQEGGGMGGITAILGQFGLGGSTGGKFNLDKIAELARSRRIVQDVLFKKVIDDNKEDYIANHLIRKYDYHELWAEDTTGLKDFYFQSDSILGFNRTENLVLMSLHSLIVGDVTKGKEGIFNIGYNEMTHIFTIIVNSVSESISIALTNGLYKRLSDFYVLKSTEKQDKTYDIAKAKADSIYALLNQRQYASLNFQDSQRGLQLRTAEARRIQLEREVQLYTMAYGEALKNVEISDFALKNATPFFQLIDYPVSPIIPVRQPLIRALIFGGLLGGFIGLALIFLNSFFRSFKN